MRILAATVQAEGLGYPEGPLVLGDGRVAFVEQYRSRVSILEADQVRTLAVTGGNPNGLALGRDGTVWVTRGRGILGEWRADELVPPAIVVVEPASGRTEIVTTTADGVPLRAPNDLCFGPDGALYFTDPDDYDPEAPIRGWICRLDASGAKRLHELENTFPNGLAFDREGRLLWVESIARRVVRDAGDGPRVMAAFPEDAIPDGFAVAEDGRIVVATLHSGGIDVVTLGDDDAPAQVQRVALQDGVALTNLAFDGPVLWATDVTRDWIRHREPTGRLWRYETDATGLPLR